MQRLVASSLRYPALALAPLAASSRRSVSFASTSSSPSGRRSRSGSAPYNKRDDGNFRCGGRSSSAFASSSNTPASGGGKDRARSYGGPIKDRYPPMLVDRNDPRRRLAVLVDGTNSNLLRAASGVAGGDVAESIRQSSPLYTAVLPAILNVGVPVLLRVFAHELPPEWAPLLAGAPALATPTGDGGAQQQPGRDGTAKTKATLLPLPSSETAVKASTSSSTSSAAGGAQIQFEFFRVERFIPIPMQIEADAQHLYDFRHQNLIEGVCYVCHEVDRSLYESIVEEQVKGSFLSTTAAAAALQATAWLSPSRAPTASSAQAGHSAKAGEHGSHGGSATPHVSFFNQYLLDELGMVKEVNADERPGNGA